MRFIKPLSDTIKDNAKLPNYLCLVSTIAFLCTFAFSGIVAIILAVVYGFWSLASLAVLFVEWEVRRLKKAAGEIKEF